MPAPTCCHVQHTQVPLEHVQSKDELGAVTLLQHSDAAGGEVASNLHSSSRSRCNTRRVSSWYLDGQVGGYKLDATTTTPA
jgi:hypothetical protein